MFCLFWEIILSWYISNKMDFHSYLKKPDSENLLFYCHFTKHAFIYNSVYVCVYVGGGGE